MATLNAVVMQENLTRLRLVREEKGLKPEEIQIWEEPMPSDSDVLAEAEMRGPGSYRLRSYEGNASKLTHVFKVAGTETTTGADASIARANVELTKVIRELAKDVIQEAHKSNRETMKLVFELKEELTDLKIEMASADGGGLDDVMDVVTGIFEEAPTLRAEIGNALGEFIARRRPAKTIPQPEKAEG